MRRIFVHRKAPWAAIFLVACGGRAVFDGDESDPSQTITATTEPETDTGVTATGSDATGTGTVGEVRTESECTSICNDILVCGVGNGGMCPGLMAPEAADLDNCLERCLSDFEDPAFSDPPPADLVDCIPRLTELLASSPFISEVCL
ncbi:MAG: hypothetical protein AAGA56_25975 [Myxococcota bacterium]